MMAARTSMASVLACFDPKWPILKTAVACFDFLQWRTPGKPIQHGRASIRFLAHLRERVIGAPEISTDGCSPYQSAIRDVFGNATHGVIVKTYSVTNLAVKAAARRYSPAEVIAVERTVVNGNPDMQISTSYVERSNLTIRMSSKRFSRLSNGFSKRLNNHLAAVALRCALQFLLSQRPA